MKPRAQKSQRLQRLIAAIGFLIIAAPAAWAECGAPADVCDHATPGALQLIADRQPISVIAEAHDLPGVLRAARGLQADLGAVAGEAPTLDASGRTHGRAAIIVGALGHSRIIDRLVRQHKLDVSGVAGVWEAYTIQIVERPMHGVDRALVIAGADKRGAIFGAYDLSARIGVSPWTWWADVPVQRHDNLFITAGRRADHPRVKYRGIFLNDEDPSLKGWADEKFGGLNHQFYEHVFELILRLKGDYLWPAMWGKSLWDDDPLSAGLADEMGVVLGNSHHEPMMRAQVEWARYGRGDWDYTTNAETLRQFWREGMIRRGARETIVTIGMRGDGDMPMTQGTAIELLERIVHDQRQIIADVTHKPASQTPQLWALYKEVQDYYDQGMRVPDDVTLLFSDDNWGDIRRLPPLGAAPRAGGYGIYYHFDYVGGPRNYKWINTNQIERVWEQMSLAREYGADHIWIVNVGDLKPMEYPISFFLDYAWNPEAWPLERLGDYPRLWAAQQFGPEHAAEIGELLKRYTQFNARRKPELLSPDTFSLDNFNEAERVMRAWDDLRSDAERTGSALPAADQDAYFQLVLHPITASANLNQLYGMVAANRAFIAAGAPSLANRAADEAEQRFARDAEITARYHALGGGRWNHMMDQTHIGYTRWQQPDQNIMPDVRRAPALTAPTLGLAFDGGLTAWPGPPGQPELHLSRYSNEPRVVMAFNRGDGRYTLSLRAGAPWIRFDGVARASENEISGPRQIIVSVDWDRAPRGRTIVPITARGAGVTVTANAVIDNPGPIEAPSGAFIEADGYVAIEAEHYARAIDGAGRTWRVIPNLGRTLSGLTAFPRAVAPIEAPGGETPHLDYQVYLTHPGDIALEATLAPTLDFLGRGGLRYAVSLDDEAPQIVVANADDPRAWNRWVADNAIIASSRHNVAAPGVHTLHVWLVDPGLVFERFVLVTQGPLPQSYLGPPESLRAH